MEKIEAVPPAECHPVPILDGGRMLASYGTVIRIDDDEYMCTAAGWVNIWGDTFTNEGLRNVMARSAGVVVYNPVPVRI